MLFFKINQKLKKIYKKRRLKKTETRFFFVPFKKEGSLAFNINFIFSFNRSVIKYLKKISNFGVLSFYKNNNINTVIFKERLFMCSFLFFFIKKNNSFKINKNEIFLSKMLVIKKKHIFFLMQKSYLKKINFFFKLKHFLFSIVWFKYLESFYNVWLRKDLILFKYFKIKMFKNIFIPFLIKIENVLMFNFFNKNFIRKTKKKTLFLIKEIFSILLGHSSQGRIFLKNTNWLSFFFYRFFIKYKKLDFLKSKIGSMLFKENKGRMFGFFYWLLRLEEKYHFFEIRETGIKEKEILLALRNLYLQKLNIKNVNILNKKDRYFLSSVLDLNDFQDIKQRSRQFNLKNLTKILTNFSEQEHIYEKRFSFLKKKKKRNQETLEMETFLWKEKKLQQNEKLFVLKDLHKIFSLILGNQTSLIFINALTLTKYSFKGKIKRANYFLSKVERDLIQKYKYIAIYIQDFVRICFFSIFLKRLTFLTNFLGFQLSKLPKNRKETKFIRFLIRVIKMFAGQRREITGLKIEFKGRVNRWRRTKIIRGTLQSPRKVISYVKYASRLEFGSGKSITRKGALGIRLWIQYNFTFGKILRKILLNYIFYSKALKMKKVNRFLCRFF
jgi:hypothetical protein